jgi:hypothetical protein
MRKEIFDHLFSENLDKYLFNHELLETARTQSSTWLRNKRTSAQMNRVLEEKYMNELILDDPLSYYAEIGHRQDEVMPPIDPLMNVRQSRMNG